MQKCKLLPENEVFKFFYQTCVAIEYLHKCDIIHRDIKPENLLLDKDYNIRLCDFGWSTFHIYEERTTFCGTYEYMAPEILAKKPYNYTVDIWSLGVLLYELFHKEAPYKGRSLPEITASLEKRYIRFSATLPSDAKDLILKILQFNPRDRIQIQDIFKHAWVKRLLKKEKPCVSPSPKQTMVLRPKTKEQRMKTPSSYLDLSNKENITPTPKSIEGVQPQFTVNKARKLLTPLYPNSSNLANKGTKKQTPMKPLCVESRNPLRAKVTSSQIPQNQIAESPNLPSYLINGLIYQQNPEQQSALASKTKRVLKDITNSPFLNEFEESFNFIYGNESEVLQSAIMARTKSPLANSRNLRLQAPGTTVKKNIEIPGLKKAKNCYTPQPGMMMLTLSPSNVNQAESKLQLTARQKNPLAKHKAFKNLNMDFINEEDTSKLVTIAEKMPSNSPGSSTTVSSRSQRPESQKHSTKPSLEITLKPQEKQSAKSKQPEKSDPSSTLNFAFSKFSKPRPLNRRVVYKGNSDVGVYKILQPTHKSTKSNLEFSSHLRLETK